MSKAVKILVVGDGAVGKTCLAKMFVDGVMPDNYNPTVFENHSVKLSFEEDVSLMQRQKATIICLWLEARQMIVAFCIWPAY